jgi:ketosteroid isomerase-like protein
MATDTIEAELLALEQRYWQAMQDRDMETALSLTEFPCLVAGASGIASVSPEQYRQMMQGAKYTLHTFDIREGAQVRLLTDDVALVAYQIREEMTVDGEPVTLDAADTSVWVRRDGGWKCAMHTESVAGDGFGRDRNAQPSRR